MRAENIHNIVKIVGKQLVLKRYVYIGEFVHQSRIQWKLVFLLSTEPAKAHAHTHNFPPSPLQTHDFFGLHCIVLELEFILYTIRSNEPLLIIIVSLVLPTSTLRKESLDRGRVEICWHRKIGAPCLYLLAKLMRLICSGAPGVYSLGIN